jgi:N-acetylneuraminic acid mutarotase
VQKRSKLVLALALLVAYVGAYLWLSRRGYGQADQYRMIGFYYFPPEDTATWRFKNYGCVLLFSPVNWMDRSLGFGRRPAVSEPLLGLDGQDRPAQWSRAPSLRTDHAYHAAIAVDGRIYIAGGGADVEVFDPQRQTWESLGKSPTDCAFLGLAALGKQIYVVGGVQQKKNLATVYLFDIATKQWQKGTPLQVARSRLAVVACVGKLYAIGGYIGNGKEALDTGIVEEYDPGKQAWVKKASMPTPRHGHAAVVVNHRILVIGGYGKRTSGYGELRVVEEYDPTTDRWQTRAPMPTGRGFLGAAVVQGKVFAIGGHRQHSRVECYDPKTDTWRSLKDAPDGFDRFGIATLGDDIYLIGGEVNPRRVWRFHPELRED